MKLFFYYHAEVDAEVQKLRSVAKAARSLVTVRQLSKMDYYSRIGLEGSGALALTMQQVIVAQASSVLKQNSINSTAVDAFALHLSPSAYQQISQLVELSNPPLSDSGVMPAEKRAKFEQIIQSALFNKIFESN